MMRIFLAILLALALCEVAQAQSITQGVGQGTYPVGAIPVIASNTGTTGALTVNLNGTAGLKTYVCGFAIRETATAATIANAQLTNVVGGNLNFSMFIATTSGPMVPLEERFYPCIPTSVVNTSIGAAAPAAGTGGVVSVAIWGYYAP